MRDLDSELYSLGLSAGEYIKYDGSKFVGDTPSSGSIYTNDDTLTGDRTVSMGGNSLTFGSGAVKEFKGTGKDDAIYVTSEEYSTSLYQRLKIYSTDWTKLSHFGIGGRQTGIVNDSNDTAQSNFLLGTTQSGSAIKFGIGSDIRSVLNADGLSIGTTADPTARLDVYAQGALSTDVVYRVRNSADTLDLFTINGAGSVYGSGPSGNSSNSVYGLDALGSISGGVFNTAFGNGAGGSMTNQSFSTFVGYNAGTAVNGGDGTYIGYNAGLANINGIGVTAIGSNALKTFTSGNYHTAVGREALGTLPGGTTGNTALGNRAGYNVNTGVASASYGTFIGYLAGNGCTTARENIFIGAATAATGITNGYENTIIGSNLTGLTNANGQVVIANGNGGYAINRDANGNIALGDQSALATTATDGFNYVRGGAGAPTGTPATSITGHVPMYADTTNNKLYIYSGGAWVALN